MNKSVCIVGNSNRINDGDYGEHIDSCDVVIRLNEGVFGGEDTSKAGSKIDIVCFRATGYIPSRNFADCISIDVFNLCKEYWIPVTYETHKACSEETFFDMRPDVDKSKCVFATDDEWKFIMDDISEKCFGGNMDIGYTEESAFTTGFLTLMLCLKRFPENGRFHPIQEI